MINLKCTKLIGLICPKCGSKNFSGFGTEHCHCGNCGQELHVEIVETVNVGEETAPEFTQISMFS